MNSFNAVPSANSMVEIVTSNWQTSPNKTVFTFLKDGEQPTDTLTNEELYYSALAVAKSLHQAGLQPGDRALLLYPAGLDFIRAFIGCLFAGVIAVPAVPPKKNRPLTRMLGIIANADPKIILTQGRLTQELATTFSQTPAESIPLIDTSLIASGTPTDFTAPTIHPESLAFLQYTSGSTGSPKGVMVSHKNIVTNEQQIRLGFGLNDDSRVLTWLPAHHDMGLIGGILQPIFSNISCHVMAPAAFVQKPIRWLRAISQFNITTTGGPNFGYDLCIKYITEQDKQALDLSRWICAFSGAEKVRADTLKAFSRAFESVGFREKSFFPCYGMAETTLFVSGGSLTAPPIVTSVEKSKLVNGADVSKITHDQLVDVVGCGKALMGESILIVDPDSQTVCPTDTVGEIWVQGDNVAQGYWQNNQATQDTFKATPLPSRASHLNTNTNININPNPNPNPNPNTNINPGHYFRTGDLGFMDDQQELFICGRLKELLIINGVKYHPQDIERTTQTAHNALTLNSGAAFAIELEKEGREALVVINEVERWAKRELDDQAVINKIRRAISVEHELEAEIVILVKPLSVMKTSSGKVQRLAMKQAFENGELSIVAEYRRGSALKQTEPVAADQLESANSVAPMALSSVSDCGWSSDQLQSWLVAKVAAEIGMAESAIDVNLPLADYGLNSVAMVRISGELEEKLQRSLPSTLLYDYSTINQLAEYLSSGDNPKFSEDNRNRHSFSEEKIAVVGMGCRLPGGVNGLEDFWQLLTEGKSGIKPVPSERWQWDGKNKATQLGGFLDAVDEFDPEFFNISPKEAESLDPQQRLLLEVCWQALEDAVLAPNQLQGSQTGVFVGISGNDYARVLEQSGQLNRYFATGNSLSTAAGRIAYFLGLTGPAMAVDTSCSSSLVAVHNAANELLQGNCNAALAGGVNLILSPTCSNVLAEANMLSEDGRCATFDDAANGYVRGEGCGVVVLKRLSDAERDGDKIYGVIAGTALNQDGRSNGLTAPNGLAQQQVLRAALARAGVSARDVDYVEAHGTGTPLGDPIELNALQRVYGNERENPLLVGSVKTNIGHLESAAGIAGLIKVLLSIHQGQLPAHLHLHNKSQHFNWQQLDVPVETLNWRATVKSFSQQPAKVAGVSSFGFSGTNAHLIVQSPPASSHKTSDNSSPFAPATRAEKSQLITLSAKTASALPLLLARCQQRVAEYFSDEPLEAIAESINAANCHFPYRFAAVVQQLDDFAQLKINGEIKNAQEPLPICLLFSGQGSQRLEMGRDLYHHFAIVKSTLDECDSIMRAHHNKSLLEFIFAQGDVASDRLEQTEISQPALFAIEMALFRLLTQAGVKPAGLLGHSVGEFAAACAAGVFSLPDAMKLVIARGRLMQAQQPGAMVAVQMSETEARAIVEEFQTLSVAAVNGPKNVVIAGPLTDIEHLTDDLLTKDIAAKRLRVSHAFHSQMMAPMIDEFRQVLNTVQFATPTLPLISNVSGQFADDEVAHPDYWCQHILAPVLFFKGAQTLAREVGGVFVECGPTPTLTSLAKEGFKQGELAELVDAQKIQFLPTLRAGKPDDYGNFLKALASLYSLGWNLSLDKIFATAGHKLAVVHQPFERKRYWPAAENAQPALPSVGGSVGHPLIGREINLPLAKEHRFAASLGAFQPPYMNDHRLYGTVVSPAASHLSSIIRSARQLFELDSVMLQETAFEQAMVLGEDRFLDVQIVVSQPENNISEWLLVSTPDDADEPVVHARGQLSTQALPASVNLPLSYQSPAAIKAAFNEPVPGSDFYQRMWRGGYHLGESFKWLETIYQRHREAVALMRTPPMPDNDRDYDIYPGLLDSCLQLVSLCCEDLLDLGEGDFLYVPVKMQRLQFLRSPEPGEILWGHGQAISALANQNCLAADIVLFNEAGQPLLALEGFETRRISRKLVQLDREPKEETNRDWLYQVIWQAEQRPGYWLPPDYLPSTNRIAEKVSNTWSQLIQAPDLQAYPAVLKKLEARSTEYIIQDLLKLGWAYEPGEIFTTDALMAVLRVKPEYQRLLHRMLLILCEEQFLEEIDGGFCVIKALAQHKDLIVASVDKALLDTPEFTLLDRCGQSLGYVMRGEQDGLELLFPGGDSSVATALYTHTPGARALNTLVVESVQQAIAARPENQRIKVLEIGAGTGGTSAHLLPLFDPTMTEYVFTDMSPMFLSQAKEKFGQYPFVHYQTLDIEKSPLQQGYRQHGYDIIIAANVLHATKDMRQTLHHAYQLLATNGLLVLLEGTSQLRWLDLTFGLTEGWWRYEDTADRPHHPLMTVEKWTELLTDCDFKDVHSLVPTHSADNPLNEQSVIIAQRGDRESEHKHWLLIADQQRVAEQLASQLTELGDLCSRVVVGGDQSAEGYSLPEPTAEAFAELITVIEQERGSPVHEVIQLQGLDAPSADQSTAENLFEHLQMLTTTNLAVIKTLAEQLDSSPRKLRLVSNSAIGVAEQPIQGLAGATLWGLGKSVAMEYPELRCQRVDLTMDSAHSAANDLLALLHSNTSETEVAIRNGQMRYSRLAHYPLQTDDGQTLSLDRQGAYVITGGLNGLGLLTAEWLISKGASKLILIGRSQPLPEVASKLQAWREQGIDSLVLQADVSDYQQFAVAFAQARAWHGNIKGAIHSAGTLDDALITNQTWQKFANVMKAKVKGAWNLHALTQDLNLDFFVLYSSAASLLGSPGQANHCAGNSFMDSLAAYRHNLNLPALSINWGVWSEIGAAVRHQAEKHVDDKGVTWIPPKDGLELLERLMCEPAEVGQVGVVPLDWSLFEQQLKAMQYPPYFAKLRDARASSAVGSASARQAKGKDWLAALNGAASSERIAMLVEYLTEKVADALGADSADSVDVETPINDLGFDSLMAMDLVADFNAQLGVKLPSSKLFQNPSINQLAEISLELLVAGEKLTPSDDAATNSDSTGAKSGNWLAYHNAQAHSKVRLFCLHYLGGGASVFREWGEALGPDIEVCAIQLPGREERIDETPIDNMPDMVEAIWPHIEPLLDKPFAFYGHSMGSMISYELIKAIAERKQLHPLHFWASAYFAPHAISPFQRAGGWTDDDILEVLPRLIEAPKQILENEGFVNTLLPTIRGDLGIVSSYVFDQAGPLNCPITAMGGKLDKEVKLSDVAEWHQHTLDDFEQVTLSGGHIFVNDNQQDVIDHIKQTLSRVLRGEAATL